MGIAIIQNYDQNYKRLGEYITKNKHAYALKHGYQFYSFTDENQGLDEWWWHNIKTVCDFIADDNNKNIDWVMWSDVDSAIMDFDFKLESLLPEYPEEKDKLFVASLWRTAGRHFIEATKPGLIIREMPTRSVLHYSIHTGNFLIKNCMESFYYLMGVYRDSRFRTCPVELLSEAGWDELALGISYLEDSSKREKWIMCPEDYFTTTHEGYMEFIDMRNQLSGTSLIPWYREGNFIVHAMGRDEDPTVEERKLRILKEYIDEDGLPRRKR